MSSTGRIKLTTVDNDGTGTDAGSESPFEGLLAQLSDLLDKKLAPIIADFGRLERKVDKLDSNFNQLERKVDNLDSNFNGLYNFSHDRLSTLESATTALNVCMNDGWISTATGHAVYYNGFVAMVTVAHTNCSGIPPADYVVCDGVDLAFVKGCPLGGSATRLLNINVFAKIRLGDEAVAFGFKDGNNTKKRAWAGSLMGELGSTNRSLPFMGLPTHDSDEHVISGVQLMGMSGAPVANGCGYLGLAHARMDQQYSAVVIPVRTIMKCMDDKSGEFSTLGECQYLERDIVNLPRSPSCTTSL